MKFFVAGLFAVSTLSGIVVAQNRQVTQSFEYETANGEPIVGLQFTPFDTKNDALTLEQVLVSFAGDLSMSFTVKNFDPRSYDANEWFIEAYHNVLFAFKERPGFPNGGPFYGLGGTSIRDITGDLSAGSGGDPFNPGVPGELTVSASFSGSIDSIVPTDASSFSYFLTDQTLEATVGPFTEMLISPPPGAFFIDSVIDDVSQSGTLSLTYEYSLNAGDFNNDQIVDQQDIDLLYQNLGGDVGTYDLNGLGQVDQADVEFLVEELLQVPFGDSNLDGTFNSGDLVLVFQAGEYEDNVAGNSTWAEGDWNGDQEFDTSDLVFVFNRGGFSNAAVSVPEPANAIWIGLFGSGACWALRRRATAAI